MNAIKAGVSLKSRSLEFLLNIKAKINACINEKKIVHILFAYARIVVKRLSSFLKIHNRYKRCLVPGVWAN